MAAVVTRLTSIFIVRAVKYSKISASVFLSNFVHAAISSPRLDKLALG